LDLHWSFHFSFAIKWQDISNRFSRQGSADFFCRADIVRQFLVEGFLLALAGGVAGLLVAYWSTGALVRSMARLAPIDLVYSAGPDTRVLFATIGFCVLCTILFGLGPA
jgi:ABC-type antimicrobial peptide transport system permease subunit